MWLTLRWVSKLEKITAMRNIMKEKGIAAYVIPGSDAHQSEYIAEHFNIRKWISGFTGSCGLVVVTAKEAGLWTDGRYFIQAQQELPNSGVSLFKMDTAGVPNYRRFLFEQLSEGDKIGFDGKVLSVLQFEALKKELISKNISYHYDEDIAGDLWIERPSLPNTPAFVHEKRFTGMDTIDKLSIIRSKMKEKRVDMYLVSALDEVAWSTNLRGNDIPHTPVIHAYMLIGIKEAWLFTDSKVEPMQGVTVLPYADVFLHLQKYDDKTILYTPNGTSVKLFHSIKGRPVKGNIIQGLKAVKNPIEIENFKNAFIKEGVTMVRFLKWLSENSPSEMQIVQKLTELRKSNKDCLGDSFGTIAAYGKNAAIVHYNPNTKKPENETVKDGFLLVDTGGQYLDGTTDITRTIVVGDETKVSDEMKRDFTLVLKGNIALARAKFLQGTVGMQLDILARQYLWQAGMDYKHGTGHGIGYCLSVHEGPANISTKANNNKLLPGMMFSNEPGLYKEGRYGIRIENLMLVKEACGLDENEHGVFLEFEVMSLCPIDTRAIDMTLLTPDEVDYLNSYHQNVYEKLSPFLTEDERQWLRRDSNDGFGS